MTGQKITSPDRQELDRLRRKVAELESQLARLEQRGVPVPAEKSLSSIALSPHDIFYRLDPEGRIVHINDAVRHWGYDPEHLLGRSILDYVHPEDLEQARFRLNERRTGERATRLFEIRLFTPAGMVDVEYSSLPVTDSPVFLVNAEGLYEPGRISTESFLGTQGIARDITGRRRTEETLRRKLAHESLVSRVLNMAVRVDDLAGFQEDCLAAVGETLGVDNLYIFEYDPEKKTLNNTVEWCAAGTGSRKKDLQGIPAGDYPWLMESLESGRHISYSGTGDIPAKEMKRKLPFRDVRSVLAVPLLVENRLQGFMGFAEYECHRECSEEDLNRKRSQG